MESANKWALFKFKSELRASVKATLAPLAIGVLVALTAACGGGDTSTTAAPASSAPAVDNTDALAADLTGQLGSSLTSVGGVMELTISGLGSNNPQTETKWLDDSGFGPRASRTVKTQAGLLTVPPFVDVASFATSTKDSGGFRYIAATIKVRNAPQCVSPATPGTCAGYVSPRVNLTFMAVMQPATINQTAVSRFKRFDGSDANFALTPQLLPAHGLTDFIQVDPGLASMQVFTESEVAAVTPDPGVTSIFPYGFVVRNVNNNSRILPGSPAPFQYDGLVTFGFKIPLQASPTDDPFKISMRFQTVDDTNRRFTQGLQEQSFAGDIAASGRALNLTSADFSAGLSANDLVVLGGRVARTTIGNPICKVRTAGLPASPTAYLVNVTTPPPNLAAAPMNLSFVDRDSAVSLGFCENMNSPTASTLVVNGSQSGRRVVGGAYGGTITGGGISSRRSQLVWDISGARPFFPNEEVSFTATSGNSTVGGASIARFVGSFRVKGSTTPAFGGLRAATAFPTGALPGKAVLGDVNGDGVLDLVVASQSTLFVSVLLGDGAGGFGATTPILVGATTRDVVLGDVNRDGNLDLVTANPGTDNISVLLGNGAGGFGAAASYPMGDQPVSVRLADVNGDGILDVLTANRLSNDIYLRLGNSAGMFNAFVLYPVGSAPNEIALGDLNNDGSLDIVVVNQGSNNFSVLLNNGVGAYLAPTSFASVPFPGSLALGDMNNDGHLDVVVASQAGPGLIGVYRGNGAGSLGSGSSSGSGAAVFSVTLGDMDADGALDIVGAVPGSDVVVIKLGNGAGGVSSTQLYLTGTNPFSATLGELNTGGRLDLVTSNSGSNDVTVRLGI